MSLTVYIQDAARGSPAEGITVILERQTGGCWDELDRKVTQDNGFVSYSRLAIRSRGIYRVTLDLDSYFVSLGEESFYPKSVTIFRMSDANKSFHMLFFITSYSYSNYNSSLPSDTDDDNIFPL